MESAARIEGLLKELGLTPHLTRVSDTIWVLRKGSTAVQIVAAPEFVVATAQIAARGPTQDAEKVFRTLLTAQSQMFGAFFTLERDGTIRVNQIMPAEWLNDRELAFIVGNVAEKADEWDGKLAAMLAPAGEA